MKKLQLLHDYLVDTHQVREDQLQVWMDEGLVTSSVDHANKKIVKRKSGEANVIIENYAINDHDIDALEMQIIWWLSAYQTNRKEDYRFEVDYKDRHTADIWIRIELDEKAIFEKGKTQVCIKPYEVEALPETFQLWLSDQVTQQEKHIANVG